LLPEALLRYAERDGEAIPLWLTAKDEVWIRALTGRMDGFVGRTAGELDEPFRRSILPMCSGMGAPRRAPSGVRHVLDDHFPRRIDAAARPCEIRQALFTLAAELPTRQLAVQATGSLLGIDEDKVLSGLFADRSAARRIEGCEELPSPSGLAERYNLALLQGLIQRAELVRVRAREHVRSVVRYAKLRSLICVCSADGAGTRIDMSGPMSLFHHTVRYGHAIAAFLPALLSTPGWEIEARCLLRSFVDQPAAFGAPVPRKHFIVRVQAGAPLARTHALPKESDSAVERRLMRDVRRLNAGWLIERETDAVQAGQALFFPDFTLRRGSERVLVEIVGYYTPAYLQHKLQSLKAAGLSRIVVCVDQSLACADGDVDAAAVLRYTRKINAAELLAAAERVVDAPELGG